MATLRFQQLNGRNRSSRGLTGLPHRGATADQYANVVKDEAHGAMRASEFNPPGASKAASRGRHRAGFQPAAGPGNKITARYLMRDGTPGEPASEAEPGKKPFESTARFALHIRHCPGAGRVCATSAVG